MTKYLFAGFILFFLAACNDDEGENIPAYIYVEAFTVETDYEEEGTARHRISDVWVNAEGNTIGAFELPARIPVLEEGNTTIRLQAGVIQNGIASLRSRYPFFEPYEIEVNLEPAEVDTLEPVVRYRDRTDFLIIESFDDDDNLAIEMTNASDGEVEITDDPEEVYEGDGSLKAMLGPGERVELRSKERFGRTLGRPLFLEMNYKNDQELLIGIFAYNSPTDREFHEMMRLGPREDWGKVYINLKDFLDDVLQGRTFRVFIGALAGGDQSRTYYLDNVKLLHE